MKNHLSTFIYGNLYAELIEILEVLFAGVDTKWISLGFKPDLVYPQYKILLEKWIELDKRSHLKKLHISEFKGFYDLKERLEEKITLWEKVRISYYESKKIIENNLPMDYYKLPAEILKIFDDAELVLQIFQNQKEYLFELKNLENIYIWYYIIFDFNRGVFFYDNKEHDFEPGIDEFKFLKILLHNRDKITTYEEINNVLQKTDTRITTMRNNIQQVRKNLKKILPKLHITKNHADYMMESIKSKTNYGYILS